MRRTVDLDAELESTGNKASEQKRRFKILFFGEDQRLETGLAEKH
jgi:hypothetical protein